MTASRFNDMRGTLADAHTLRMQRRLPGPIERVWSYLADSDLRRQWLASGVMPMQPGASFELVWRNDELSGSAAERPEGFSAESRATCQFIEVDPPRRMRYIWPGVGEVCIELEAVDDEVMLTLTHCQLLGERLILNVCAGWHAHLELLIAHLEGQQPPSLWRTWTRLRKDYEEQLCAN
jgi:uncharacterized protein YndB with AHSA1/START domain